MESEALRRRAMSEKEVQQRLPQVEIQAASFGELQLSFGKTEPPRVAIERSTSNSSSGKEGFLLLLSSPSSSSDSESKREREEMGSRWVAAVRGRGSRPDAVRGRRKSGASVLSSVLEEGEMGWPRR